MSKIEADSEGHDEVILHKDGFLNEGAVSNLFLFINDDLHTPSLDANILPGVTRAKLINLAEANNINVIQRIIPLSEIDNAQEVFMSSTTKGVIPVLRIIGSKFDIDKVQQKIESLEHQIKNTKNNLLSLVDYAISYFKELKKNYSSSRSRKTEIRVFNDVDIENQHFSPNMPKNNFDMCYPM